MNVLSNDLGPITTTVGKLKLGPSAKDYVRTIYEYLRSSLDFNKDNKSINYQSFMCWRDRFLFV